MAKEQTIQDLINSKLQSNKSVSTKVTDIAIGHWHHITGSCKLRHTWTGTRKAKMFSPNLFGFQQNLPAETQSVIGAPQVPVGQLDPTPVTTQEESITLSCLCQLTRVLPLS